jgi:hypothetical protein
MTKYKEKISTDGKFIINNYYPLAFIISKEEVKEELEGNECFFKCENVPTSKYKFYVDEEVVQYFATLKGGTN